MSDAASDLARLRAALAAAEARAEVEALRAATAEAELAQARALASATEAVIKALRLEIALPPTAITRGRQCERQRRVGMTGAAWRLPKSSNRQ